MKKRLLTLALSAIMLTSISGCATGSTPTATNAPAATTAAPANGGDTAPENAEIGQHEKITVWTITADLKQFAQHYTELTGNEVEVVEIKSGDYQTKLQAALGGRSKEVDVIVGEPQMLPPFFEAGFFSDLSIYGAQPLAQEKIVDYVYDVGVDEQGVLRAISWQSTPGSVIYRRDLALEVWGTDDPAVIAEKYKDYDTILQSAKEIKDKGYRIFCDEGSLRWFSNSAGSWLNGNDLVLSEDRLKYFDVAVELYNGEYIANAPEWSSAWYSSMGGELPINAGWTDVAEIESGTPTTQILSYVMPSWGALIIRDSSGDNFGKFGVAPGPNSFFGGGTFMGINEFSEKKDAAWEFVKFCTLNEETSQWWLEVSKGDVVSMKSVLEANKDIEVEAFGGQKTYEFYLEEAKKIDYSIVTGYDDQIGTCFANAMAKVKEGTATKDEAIAGFYKEVKELFPEINVPTA